MRSIINLALYLTVITAGGASSAVFAGHYRVASVDSGKVIANVSMNSNYLYFNSSRLAENEAIQLSTVEWLNAIPLDVGDYPRTAGGLEQIEDMVSTLEDRANAGDPEAPLILERLYGYRSNLTKILELLEPLDSGRDETVLSYDETARMVTFPFIASHIDLFPEIFSQLTKDREILVPYNNASNREECAIIANVGRYFFGNSRYIRGELTFDELIDLADRPRVVRDPRYRDISTAYTFWNSTRNRTDIGAATEEMTLECQADGYLSAAKVAISDIKFYNPTMIGNLCIAKWEYRLHAVCL